MNYVLTYDHPHRKTQDLLFRLRLRPECYDTHVVIMPWKYKDNHEPLIPHRWFEPIDMDMGLFCDKLGYTYSKRVKLQFEHKPIVLIGGSGIIPDDVISQAIFINSHPGYLPYSRGLDALKWAIYEGYPTGVTLHQINKKIDAGLLIRQQMLNPKPWETFHSFAQRLYDLEINMLTNAFEYYYDNPPLTEFPNIDNYEVHRRMPAIKETYLLEKFEAFKRNYV